MSFLNKFTYICKVVPRFVVIKHRRDISFENFFLFALTFSLIFLQLLSVFLEFIFAEDVAGFSRFKAVLNVHFVSDRRQRNTCHSGSCFLGELGKIKVFVK